MSGKTLPIRRAQDGIPWTLLASEDDYQTWHANLRARYASPPPEYPAWVYAVMTSDEDQTYLYLTLDDLIFMARDGSRSMPDKP